MAPRETKLDAFLSGDSADVIYKSDLPAVLNPVPVRGPQSQNGVDQLH